jgi:uracil-DNA glycosylase family 4
MSDDLTQGGDANALAALLDWYAAIGVDLAVDDAPHDRFAESARPAQPVAPATRAAPLGGGSPARPADAASVERTGVRVIAGREGGAPALPEEAARVARELASGAADLEELRRRLEAFDGCALKATAGHFVSEAGTPGARLMALDYSPGEEEERSGDAFIGPEARLLDNMLAAIGLNRGSAYLAYATPWRPPGGRELNAPETAALLPFVQRRVELAAPRVLLILGDSAAKAALGGTDVARLRGAWFDYACGARSVRAILVPGLSTMLKTPVLKRRAWRDLRSIFSALR